MTVEGLRVGVTGARRAAELAAALRRRGAEAIIGPMVLSDQPVADETIVGATDAIIEQRPVWFAASTGVGMRLWAEVARAHGRYERLCGVLGSARAVARGAKAVGGLAAFRISPEHVTDEETDDAVVRWLLERAAPGESVAVQLHGGETTTYDRLSEHGLDVLALQPYVAGRRPEEEQLARTLIQRVVDREIDVVTFTSPGAARNLYALASEMGPDVEGGVDEAFGHDVAVAVVGPVTAQVLEERGVPIAIQPARHRQGALVRAIEGWDPEV